MPEKYMLYPTTVIELCGEMKKAVDDYKAHRISSAELQETVLAWAHNVPEKFFDGVDYNVTIKRLVGVRRLKTVDKMLDGYQMALR